MIKKKLLSLAMAGTIGLTTLASPTVLAKAAPSTVSEFDTLISDLTSEQNEASNKLAKLQKEIKENEAEAESLVAEMEETKELLEKLQNEIEDLNLVIDLREAHLEDQARALQIMGESGNIVNFVLNADSLNDVVGRIDVVSTLISSNKQTLAQQEEDKAQVEAKENETVKKQEEQNKIAGKLEANKNALAERQAEQESMLASIAAEKSKAKEERSTLVAQAEAAEQRRKELETARTVSASASSDEVTTASSTESSAASSTASSTASSSSASSKAKTETPAAPKAPAANGGSVVSIAHSLTGTPYSYSGTTPAAFDCSGYTSYVFNQAGRSLPRTAAGQYSATTRISQSQAQPGDLVFFSQGGGIDHVGIYLGGGSFIGSQTSTGVAVSTINSGYWSNYVAGFGR